MLPEVRTKSYKAGTAVVIQNARNPGMFYIVRKGVLAIDTEHRLSDKVLSRFEAGDSFGLVSALTGHNFLVTIYADTDAEVAEVPIAMIGEYIRPEPHLAVKILRLYSRELRTIQQHLARLDQRADRDATPERLFVMAERYKNQGKLSQCAHVLNAYIHWAQQNSGQNLQAARSEFEQVRSHFSGLEFGGHPVQVKADTMLFCEGEMGQDIYVVIEGAVKLMRFARGGEFVIDVLGPGELFGEMAFIEQAPRMGSAVTIQNSKIMRIRPEQLVASVATGVLQRIFESLARRIWFAHQRLVIFKIGDPLMRMYAYLYNLTRNQNLRAKEKNPMDRSYRFDITIPQLMSLCGILQLKEASLAEFRANENLQVDDTAITVRSRKRLADQISFYRAKTGQIVAETK